MKKILNKIIILTFFSIITTSFIKAQENPIYFLSNIPQYNTVNPAFVPKCRFYTGFKIYTNIYNTGFAYKDLFVKKDNEYFLNIDGFYDQLANNNYVGLIADISLLNLGFKAGNWYVNFAWDFSTNAYFNYPKGIFRIKDGIYYEDGTPVDFSGLGPNATVYHSLNLGLSKEVNDLFTFGFRIKRVYGLADLSVKKSDIKWYIDNSEQGIYGYKFETDINISAALPFPFSVKYDENGNISDIDLSELDNVTENPNYQNIKQLIFNDNRGWGFDFGITYNILDNLQASASIVDLGYIKWKNASVLEQNATFEFEGLTLEQLKDPDNFTSQLADSITNMLQPKISSVAYKTGLNTKIYFGLRYSPLKWVNLGVMTRSMFYDGKIHPSLFLSSSIQFGKGGTLGLSYSMVNRSYNNIGISFSLFGFYLLAEQIKPVVYILNDSPSAVNGVKSLKNINLSIGYNIKFGCKQRTDYMLID